MKEFHSLEAFAGHLAKQAIVADAFIHEGLDRAAKLVETTAKSEFGHYQPQTGPFPEWPELADSTQEQREAMGYTPNDPLYRTGSIRDSVSRAVHGLDAVVGSTSDLMIYHEFGTSRMPARPVFGPAVFRNRKEIQTLVGLGAFLGVIGARSWGFAELRSGGQVPVHEDLGYDYEASAGDE